MVFCKQKPRGAVLLTHSAIPCSIWYYSFVARDSFLKLHIFAVCSRRLPLPIVDDDAVDCFLSAFVGGFVANGGNLNEHTGTVCGNFDLGAASGFAKQIGLCGCVVEICWLFT